MSQSQPQAFRPGGGDHYYNAVEAALDKAKLTWPPAAWQAFQAEHPLNNPAELTVPYQSKYGKWLDSNEADGVSPIDDSFAAYMANWLAGWQKAVA